MSSRALSSTPARTEWTAYGHTIVQTGSGRDARFMVLGTLELWPSLALARRYAKRLSGHVLE